MPEAANYDLDGVLVIREKLDQGLVSQAFAINAVAVKGAGGPSPSLLAAMGLAMAGGLILNLMPCVLPVLSIKALALVGHRCVASGAKGRETATVGPREKKLAGRGPSPASFSDCLAAGQAFSPAEPPNHPKDLRPRPSRSGCAPCRASRR